MFLTLAVFRHVQYKKLARASAQIHFEMDISQGFPFANFHSGVLISVEKKKLHCCRRRGDVEKNNVELFCFGLTGVWLSWEVLLLQRRMQIRADCTKRAVHSKVLTQDRCIIDEHQPCTKQLRTCSDRGCPCIERNIGEGLPSPPICFHVGVFQTLSNVRTC